EGGNRSPRLISETVFWLVFATSAAPVPSLIATPIGPEPVVTSATLRVPVVKSTMEALPPVLLATIASPKRGLMAIPCGPVPTEIVAGAVAGAKGLKIVPKVGLSAKPVSLGGVELSYVGNCGAMSMTETLLQPLLVTTAMG